MAKSPKVCRIGKECLACAVFVPVCPTAAVAIVCGIAAHVDEEKCVACGKCARACPAAVIEIVERGGVERGSAL